MFCLKLRAVNGLYIYIFNKLKFNKILLCFFYGLHTVLISHIKSINNDKTVFMVILVSEGKHNK